MAPSIIPDAPGEVYGDKAYDAEQMKKAIAAKRGSVKCESLNLTHRTMSGPSPPARQTARGPQPRARGRSARALKKSSASGNAATGFGRCALLAFEGQAANPSRGDGLQCKVLLAAAMRMSGLNRRGAKICKRKPRACALSIPNR